MNTLSYPLKRVREEGFIFGFKVGDKDNEGVSHMLFANSILTFCDTKIKCYILVRLSTWFETIFVLKINLGKSELIPIRGITKVGQLFW